MTCRLGTGTVELETPLVRAEVGSRLRIGIRAGDLLLATESPRGLSARNVVPGAIRGLDQRDVIVSAFVNCSGTEFEVHLTLAAREALQFAPDKNVWLVVKTHSLSFIEPVKARGPCKFVILSEAKDPCILSASSIVLTSP